MARINTYLNFNGNAEKAFLFYQSVFGGELFIQKMKDTPAGKELLEKEQNCVMHVSLPIGKNNVLMASDIMESAGQRLIPGNNYYICLHTESRSEADQLFEKLSQNGAVEMPMEDMFWGDYFGCLKDQFGIQWMISFNEADQ